MMTENELSDTQPRKIQPKTAQGEDQASQTPPGVRPRSPRADMERTQPQPVARSRASAPLPGLDPESDIPPDSRSTRPFYPNQPAPAAPLVSPLRKKAPAGPAISPAIGRRRWVRLAWTAAAIVLVAAAITAGAFGGYTSGRAAVQAYQEEQSQVYTTEQYLLGVQDLKEGRYEIARQRFEFVITRDPNYPGATEKLVEAMQVLLVTATPTNVPPTVTPTPTRDLRPVQDLFANAFTLLSTGDWNGAIDSLNNLRSADAGYLTAKVDGMLYLALRYRGVDKILNQGDLGGGSYDLALAERFGPLDYEASTAREWARLYMYGSSFWEAYPEQAVYYFAQVAAAAPYLRDGSGWTARERYRAALMQLGDKLAREGDWCAAQEQYALAQSIIDDGDLQATAAYANEQCLSPQVTEEVATITPTATLTPTWTATAPVIFPPTDTLEPSATPSPTETQPLPETPTPTTPPPPSTTEPPTATSEPTATTEPPTPTLPEPPTPGGNTAGTSTPEAPAPQAMAAAPLNVNASFTSANGEQLLAWAAHSWRWNFAWISSLLAALQ